MLVSFIVLFMTISIIINYFRAIIRPLNKEVKAQEDLLLVINKTAKEGIPKKTIHRLIYIFAIISILYCLVFYIMSAVILDQTWSTILMAIFGVLSIRSFVQLVDVIKTEKIQKVTLFNKVIAIIGIVYTAYFLYYYISIKFSYIEIVYLIFGVVIGTVLVNFKRIKKMKKN